MNTPWFVRLALPSQPVGVRLLVLTLSIGWLGAILASVYLLQYLTKHIGAMGLATAWLAVAAVGLLAVAGHAALGRTKRWQGLLLLLSACGLGAGLLYWAMGTVLWLWVIYGD